jgi:hypothetical protein
MRQIPGIISSHSLEPLGTPSLVVELSQHVTISAGQFIMAFHPDAEVAARTRLFPIDISSTRIVFDHVPSPSWFPGQTIDFLGPIGNTFSPSSTSRNWLLLSFGNHPERLLPLIDLGRTQSASVAFWSNKLIPSLPADIERPVAPEDALDWAEFIAIELAEPYWPASNHSLRNELHDRKISLIQALVDVPTPCGLGGCQACAIPHKNSWILACQQGLVHNFEDIRD